MVNSQVLYSTVQLYQWTDDMFNEIVSWIYTRIDSVVSKALNRPEYQLT